MISYIDKGPGLDNYIAQAGHWAININGVWHTSDDDAVQALIDGYTLDEAKEYVKRQIDEHASSIREARTVGISAAEMASWSLKLLEAAAYRKSGSPDSAPLLSAEATIRGITIESIVTRVEANAAKLGALEAIISGVAGKHKDTVMAMETFTDLLGYDWRTGWPE